MIDGTAGSASETRLLLATSAEGTIGRPEEITRLLLLLLAVAAAVLIEVEIEGSIVCSAELARVLSLSLLFPAAPPEADAKDITKSNW